LTTTYTVNIINSDGCPSTGTITIFVSEKMNADLFVPTAFSPNGDGQNDILHIYGNCAKDINFEIYNRWGQKVFESHNINEGWDGIFNGQILDTGIFNYLLIATLINDKKIIQKGNITLLR